jgi:hypothetical protein
MDFKQYEAVLVSDLNSSKNWKSFCCLLST